MSDLNNESFTIEPLPSARPGEQWQAIRTALRPLASLKLTVALFAMSIILVLVGTLAQVESDIWEAVREYFRCWGLWVELRTLSPLVNPLFAMLHVPLDFRNISPWVGIPFPGGYTIGVAMLVNLLAAHSLRFVVQAKGLRMVAGLVVALMGVVVTWLVIESGHSDSGVQEASVAWKKLWFALEILLAVLCALNAAGLKLAYQWKKPETVLLGVSLLTLGGPLALMIVMGEGSIDDSGMRILWQLMKGTFAGLVLLAGATLLFKKRAGVVVLHLGVILMLVHEPLVGTLHVETQMTIDEGATASYAQDIRTTELAFVDASNPEYDDVATIPRELLEQSAAKKSVISDPGLPFDVQVVSYLRNSEPVDLSAEKENPATAGLGLSFIATERVAGAGTDGDSAVDLTASYVKLIDKESKKDLGTFVVGVYCDNIRKADWKPNQLEVGGTKWDLSLRFKRYNRPYTVKLMDVSKTDYAGTDTPRDYRSIVRLFDPTRKTDIVKHIWMNNPLRYSGETFYQSSYGMNPKTGKEQTTLSVVKNTGWMIPYVACMIVAVGMLAHFSGILLRFVSRRVTAEQLSIAVWLRPIARFLGLDPDLPGTREPVPVTAQTTGFARAFPWLVALGVVIYFSSQTRTPQVKDGQPDYAAFGRLPLLYEGRMQPFDTLSENSLKMVSGYSTYRDLDGKKQPASLWLLDVIVSPEDAVNHKVFKVDHPQLLDKLGLEKRTGFKYSLTELLPHLATLTKDAQQARDKNIKARNADERKVLELERKLGILDLLTKTFAPPHVDPESWGPRESWNANRELITRDLKQAFGQASSIDSRQPPRSIPPSKNVDENGELPKEWKTFARAWIENLVEARFGGAEADPGVSKFTDILVGHSRTRRAEAELREARERKPVDDREVASLQKKVGTQANEFNDAIEEYRVWMNGNRPADLDPNKVDFEAFFNRFSPFYCAMLTYLFAFVLSLGALIGWSKPLNRAALLTIFVTFCLHTFALAARIYISGRPPVTNLYSSAIFIGWGIVVLAMIFEGIYRLGIGNIVGAALGAATLGVAQLLSGDGDTIKVMQAVLDTQFWLWTHVTCITLGYAVTFLAGGLGLLYVLSGLFSNLLTPAFEKELTRITYGTICFGIFFSFVGTVLGGLWADDSWGRFWGWDPKENGALIIVLWNALVVHARWDGMVKDRGFAVLAIMGNVVTSWSWFGVNELGKGLHSYGFTDGVWSALWCFWLSQFVCIGLGCISKSKWVSFKSRRHLADESASSKPAVA